MMPLLDPFPNAGERRNPFNYWVVLSFRVITIAMGAVHTWAAAIRHSMNADGISYLDIGDAYVRGDWQSALNSVWSPMYSWILGPVMKVLNPPIHWEFPTVHLVNFVIYLFALVCFEFFWRQLTRWRQTATTDRLEQGECMLPAWAWTALGYTLFVSASLILIEIWAVTPDMLMSGFVYLAAGLIVRIRMKDHRWRTFVLLGVVLGLSCLAKAVMLPLGFTFFFVTLFSSDRILQSASRVFVAVLVFLSFSMPFIAVVSVLEGKLTFGAAGTLTYARYINQVPYPHWQGKPPCNGVPKHPSRKIFDMPPIYEFDGPVGGTYPISYDPSYWYEGLVVRFDFKRQMDYILFSALFYYDLFFRQQAGLLFGILLLYLASRWGPLRLRDIVRRWGLVIPALCAFGFYGLVNVTGRYVGVFVVLFWAEMLANVRLPRSEVSRAFTSMLGILMTLFMLLSLLASNLEGFRDFTGKGNLNQPAFSEAVTPSWPGEVAEELYQLGVRAGDTVAIIGYGFDAFWARLGRLRIVAELLATEAEAFYAGDATLQLQVIQAFAGTGAKAIVAEHVPSYASLPDWHQVGRTNYYIHILER